MPNIPPALEDLFGQPKIDPVGRRHEIRANRKGAAAVALSALAVVAAACGSGGEAREPSGTTEAGEDATLTVYSGRKEEFIGPLLEQFTSNTGIKLEVRYGDSAELAATILEEGANSPADVFLSQDAGSLGAVAAKGLLERIDDEILDRVDAQFRSDEGLWVGNSGRARVAAYNTDALEESELPPSILDFTDSRWKGRIGFPPTNSSFQAFVAAMILTEGSEETRAFLQGLADNDPKFYEDNSTTVRAVASGETDVGFVNHYYLYEVSAEEGEIPVANHFFTGGDPGALVNVSGSAILTSSDDVDAASMLVGYLTGAEGQTYFAEQTWEYPVAPGYDPRADVVPLDEIQAPDVDLSDLGETIDPALRLMAEAGLL